MNTVPEHKIIKVRDGGYSMRACGRLAGSDAAQGNAINVVAIEALKDGEERMALAEKRFELYLTKKTQEGYTFADLEAARGFYLQGYLAAYESVATRRRFLAQRRAERPDCEISQDEASSLNSFYSGIEA